MGQPPKNQGPAERSVLITGCSSGIGRCAALGLKECGYRVFASARGEDDVAALQAAGLEALRLDLTDSDSIANALDMLFDQTGNTLYALFNNGAYGQPGAVEDLSRQALREQFETNLFGTHELTRRVIPVMRAQGFGRIVQNNSILGLVALKYRGAYNASKFALQGLTDTLRLELHGSGIHVCSIEPGPIESRFRENSYQAYRKHIDPNSSVHRDNYQAMEERLSKEGAAVPFTLPADAVLKKVIKALESPRPRAHYYVTKPTYLLASLKRVLPTGLMDKLLLRVS